jgi:hypothetical protein
MICIYLSWIDNQEFKEVFYKIQEHLRSSLAYGTKYTNVVSLMSFFVFCVFGALPTITALSAATVRS